MNAAQAELQQETGIISSELDFLGELWTMPTKVDARVFGFLAINCVIAIDQNLDSSEGIEVVKVPINELNAHIASGKINCSDTMALLLLAKIKRAELFSG